MGPPGVAGSDSRASSYNTEWFTSPLLITDWVFLGFDGLCTAQSWRAVQEIVDSQIEASWETPHHKGTLLETPVPEQAQWRLRLDKSVLGSGDR